MDISSIAFDTFLIALLLLPALGIAHLIRNKFKGRALLIWILIILFLPFFGPILYFIMGKRYRRLNPE